MPNLNEYQPNDFYDLRPGPSSPINTSRTKDMWYDPNPRQKLRAQELYYPKVVPYLKDKPISNLRNSADEFSGRRLKLNTDFMLKRKRPRDNKGQVKLARGEMGGQKGVNR